MEWFYAEKGVQKGPVGSEEIQSLVRDGALGPSTLIWRQGMAEWQPVSQVPEFMSSSPPPPQVAGAAPIAPSLSDSGSRSPLPSDTVPNYLWQSIVCVVLCCWPAAVPAIIYACKVGPALQAGDLAAAREASNQAKMWCWISFGLGLVALVGFVLLGVVGNLAEQ